MRRKHRGRKQKILMVSCLLMLLFLCVCYAAFSTSLNLKAKGNIKDLTASQVLRKECNTETGDGLYKDIYEEGKCVYKGANPNNYIKFNNELWRILSLESDNTLKIIRSSSIENRQWDSSNNDFETSDVKEYLNNTFLSSMIDENKIETYLWNIGKIKWNNNDLQNQINDEKSLKSESVKVGLITVSEYLNANTNTIECGNLLLNNTNKEECVLTNWIYSIVPYKGWLWTITGGETNNNMVYSVHSTDGNVGYLADYFVTEYRGVSPVVYLKDSTALSGEGTKENPYIIIN